MNNTLHIKNFLIIQDTTIEIYPWTILIGPQASGKSIIAKIMYVFYHIPQFYYESIYNGKRKRFFISKVIENFKTIFPETAWEKQSFELILETARGKLSFCYQNGSNKSISFKMSEYYEKKS